MDFLNFIRESLLDTFDVEVLLCNSLLLDEEFLRDSETVEKSNDLSVQKSLRESGTPHNIQGKVI